MVYFLIENRTLQKDRTIHYTIFERKISLIEHISFQKADEGEQSTRQTLRFMIEIRRLEKGLFKSNRPIRLRKLSDHRILIRWILRRSSVIFLPAQFKTAKSHGRKLAHNRISLFLNKIQKFMIMNSGTQFYAIQFTFENNNYRRSKMEPNTSETSGWHTIFCRFRVLRQRLTQF